MLWLLLIAPLKHWATNLLQWSGYLLADLVFSDGGFSSEKKHQNKSIGFMHNIHTVNECCVGDTVTCHELQKQVLHFKKNKSLLRHSGVQHLWLVRAQRSVYMSLSVSVIKKLNSAAHCSSSTTRRKTLIHSSWSIWWKYNIYVILTSIKRAILCFLASPTVQFPHWLFLPPL